MVSLTQTPEGALSEDECSRLRELECTVAHNLSAFLEVGKALVEIRDSRLYRENYANFDRYLLERWGISGSRAKNLINAVKITETLLAGPAGPDGDAPLPPDLSEQALRPLAKLSPELQCATWSLASQITEKPSHTVISRIVRIVTEAIQEGYGEPAVKPKREEPANTVFLRVVYKVAALEAVSPQLIVCSIADSGQAARCVAACREVARRCHFLADELTEKFPGIS